MVKEHKEKRDLPIFPCAVYLCLFELGLRFDLCVNQFLVCIDECDNYIVTAIVRRILNALILRQVMLANTDDLRGGESHRDGFIV